MSSKFPAVIPSAIAGVFLLVALAPIHAYGYFVFMRWIVCLAAIWFCYTAFSVGRAWLLLIGIPLAILFNPIAPIHLDRETWMVLDPLAAIVLFAFSWVARSKKGTKSQAEPPQSM